MSATGLVAVQGVNTHELAQVQVVGNAQAVFQHLVHVVGLARDADISPEVLAQLTDLGDGFLEVFHVTGHTAAVVQDVA